MLGIIILENLRSLTLPKNIDRYPTIRPASSLRQYGRPSDRDEMY